MAVLHAAGSRRLDKELVKCLYNALEENVQLLYWSEYWYWEDGSNNTITSLVGKCLMTPR